jgi:hypothetical protein
MLSSFVDCYYRYYNKVVLVLIRNFVLVLMQLFFEIVDCHYKSVEVMLICQNLELTHDVYCNCCTTLDLILILLNI